MRLKVNKVDKIHERKLIMNQPLIINFFGGPACGKSTMAAGLFNILKLNNYSTELVAEFAKEKIHEENWVAIKYQPYNTSNQMYRQYIAEKNYDIVITDSPYILGIVYDEEPLPVIRRTYKEFLISTFCSKNNLNYFITRNNQRVWDQIGRCHTLEESIEKDKDIKTLLDNENINYISVDCNQITIKKICQDVINIINLNPLLT
jgi:nicotinamide riboside kinase